MKKGLLVLVSLLTFEAQANAVMSGEELFAYLYDHMDKSLADQPRCHDQLRPQATLRDYLIEGFAGTLNSNEVTTVVSECRKERFEHFSGWQCSITYTLSDRKMSVETPYTFVFQIGSDKKKLRPDSIICL